MGEKWGRFYFSQPGTQAENRNVPNFFERPRGLAEAVKCPLGAGDVTLDLPGEGLWRWKASLASEFCHHGE